jgi:AraC-like DNA-binding protein
MAESGTTTFTDPDDYRARMGGTRVNLVVTSRGDFKARLTWLKLRHLNVFRGSESLPRIAYVSLPPARVVISFPTSTTAPTWRGVELRFGDVIFHGCGECAHHWTSGASDWGVISLPSEQLAIYGKALTGLEMAPRPVGRVLRPSSIAAAYLMQLHSEACRLAETRHDIVSHPEVVRALEQELIHALVNCLKADDAEDSPEAGRDRSEIMVRFEEALTVPVCRPRTMSELCGDIGVSERTLRTCCSAFLGMGPARYVQLRRLNLARAALREAGPATDVAKIARRHGFSDLGRFTSAYRAAFGETPSATPRGAGPDAGGSAPAEFA